MNYFNSQSYLFIRVQVLMDLFLQVHRSYLWSRIRHSLIPKESTSKKRGDSRRSSKFKRHYSKQKCNFFEGYSSVVEYRFIEEDSKVSSSYRLSSFITLKLPSSMAFSVSLKRSSSPSSSFLTRWILNCKRNRWAIVLKTLERRLVSSNFEKPILWYLKFVAFSASECTIVVNRWIIDRISG